MATLTRPKNRRKITPEERKKEIERDHRMVKGIFRCYEPRGGSFKFSYKKHKGDSIKTRTLVDGQTCDIPFMVAKHLNQNCWYPRHAHVLDAEGNPTIDIGQKVQRCSFESLEFYSEEE